MSKNEKRNAFILTGFSDLAGTLVDLVVVKYVDQLNVLASQSGRDTRYQTNVHKTSIYSKTAPPPQSITMKISSLEIN